MRLLDKYLNELVNNTRVGALQRVIRTLVHTVAVMWNVNHLDVQPRI